MLFTNNALRWLEVILHERFGIKFILTQQANRLQLSLPSSDGVIIFDQLQSVFHQSHSDFPCQHWQASAECFTGPIEDTIPAPSEKALQMPLIKVNEQGATVHYDILGLTYWMLTRLEEIGRTDLDNHQRFPATSSHAYQHDYLERPVVDEWLNILGQVMNQSMARSRTEAASVQYESLSRCGRPGPVRLSKLERPCKNHGGGRVGSQGYRCCTKSPLDMAQ